MAAMTDDRLSQSDLDRIIADPLRATPVDAERMARELVALRARRTDTWLSVRNASRLAGVTMNAIRYQYRRGVIIAVHVGGRVRIEPESLNAYIATRRQLVDSGPAEAHKE